MSKTFAYPSRVPFNNIEPISVTRYLADLRDCTFSLIRKEFIKKVDFAVMMAALQKFECAKLAFFEAKYLQQLRLYRKFKKKHKHRKKKHEQVDQQEHITLSDGLSAKLDKLLLDALAAFMLFQQHSYNSTFSLILGLQYLTEQQKQDLLEQLNDYQQGNIEVTALHPATQLSLHGTVRSKKASGNIEHTREEIIQNIFPDFVTAINAACEQMCDSSVLELPDQQQTFFRELASNQLVARMLYGHLPALNACLDEAQPNPCADAKKFADIIHQFNTSDVKQELIDRSAQLLKCIVNNHAVYDFTQALEFSKPTEVGNREIDSINEIPPSLAMRV